MTVDDPLRRSQSALQLREVEPMAELSPLTAAGANAAGYSPGGVAERLIAPVLKTGRPKGLVSSNLTPSATSTFDVRCSMFDVRARRFASQ